MVISPISIIKIDEYISLHSSSSRSLWESFLYMALWNFDMCVLVQCVRLEGRFIIEPSYTLDRIEENFIKLINEVKRLSVEITPLTFLEINPLETPLITNEEQKILNELKARQKKDMLKKVPSSRLEALVAEENLTSRCEKKHFSSILEMERKLENGEVVMDGDKYVIVQNFEDEPPIKTLFTTFKNPLARKFKKMGKNKLDELLKDGNFDFTSFRKEWDILHRECIIKGNIVKNDNTLNMMYPCLPCKVCKAALRKKSKI